MQPRVFVTGGAGFVGSGVVRELLANGYDVTVYDDLSRGSRNYLPDDPRLSLVVGDILDTAALREALTCRPFAVLHLAAIHFIPYCNEHPTEAVRVNVCGTQSLLEALATSEGVVKLVFASTAAVYAPSEAAHNENEVPAPIDIYGWTKVFGENLGSLFRRQSQIAVLNARLFNVIGPRETNPHLLPDIVEQLPIDGRLELGNLVPRRDYVHVDDVASAFRVLIESDVDTGSFNVGTGVSHSPRELVDAIAKLTNTRIEIESVPERQRAGDRPNLVADTTRLQKLGWRARYDLQQGLRDTLAAYGKI